MEVQKHYTQQMFYKKSRVEKQDKKQNRRNKSDLIPFLCSDPPTHHGPRGSPTLFLAGPRNNKKNRRTRTRSYLSLSRIRAAGKNKIDGTPPRAFAKSQTHPPTIRHFFSWLTFFCAFLNVSRHGEFENSRKRPKHFC